MKRIILFFTFIALASNLLAARDYPKWLESAAIYHIYPSSYMDSDGNGYGDLEGIRSRLDYIKNLGFNTIWISPVFYSEFEDGGYDITDFYKIDPRFGTNTDLVNLVNDAHEKGIKVCLDLVAGHTSDKHPWFLESANGDSYFGTNSQYAVKGGKYAGGYAGCVDIDSAAAVGGGLKLLGNIELTNLLKALDVVASTIENSDVNGCVGGYSVLADGRDDKNQKLGKAGGFIGEMSGTIIKNSDANLFNYIIGREAAGGYAGIMEPGNVASVIEDAGILDGLLNVTDSLAVFHSDYRRQSDEQRALRRRGSCRRHH